MGSLYQGAGSCIQIKKEAVWGTAITPTEKLEIISSSLKSNVARTAGASIYTGNSGMSRKHYDLRYESGGQIVMPAKYSALGYLLEAAFGAVGTTGTGPYVHTYTLGGQNQLPSLTIEDVLGDSGNAITYAGCMVQRFEAAWSAAEAGGRFTFDLLAEDGSAPAAATSLTIDAGTVIMPYDSGTFAFNAQTYSLNSFSVTIDNGIDRRYKLGAIKTKKPQPVNQRSVTLRIVLDVDDAFQTAQLAGTQGDATITFTSGSEIAAWTVQNAWLQSTDSQRNGHGIVELTVVMMAEDDDTDAGLELIVTNAQANYYD